jgi:membrane protease YdiL (CAAX protease family)
MSGTDARNARRDRWVWISLLPLGLGSWAPMIAGGRCRVWWWTALGSLWPAMTVAGFVVAGGGKSHGSLGAALLWCGWIGAVVTSFSIRPAYDRHRGFPLATPAWPRPTPRSQTWPARYGVIAFFVVFVIDGGLGLLFHSVLNIHFSVGVAVLLTDATLLAALIPMASRRGVSARDLGIRATVAMPSLGLVVLALIVYVVFAAVWALAFIGRSTEHSANLLSQVNHLGTLGTIIAVVAVGLSAPIVEEIFFRGLLYRSLRNRLPVVQAALIAGMLFGLAHITGYPLITLPIKAVFGVIACLIYERTGSLVPGMALHAFVDASAVDITLTGNDYIVLAVTALAIFALLGRAGVLRLAKTRRSSDEPHDAQTPIIAPTVVVRSTGNR